MFDIELFDEDRIIIESSSKGTQAKYKKDGYWYKENKLGDEATGEILSSAILEASSLPASDYVVYETGIVNHFKRACRSKNFMSDNEELITLYKYYEKLEGKSLVWVLSRMEANERAAYTIEYFKDMTGLDLTDYFKKIFTLDLITLNEDRHLNNFAIIRNAEGIYRAAPLFDNGLTFFTGSYSYNVNFSFEENRLRAAALPFTGRDSQYELFPNGFTIDFDTCINKINQLSIPETSEYMRKTALDSLAYTKEHYPELFVFVRTDDSFANHTDDYDEL